MAGEIKHKQATLAGGDQLPRVDWEGTDTHEADGQAVGMVIYFDGTSWICKLLKDIAVTANWDIGSWKITAKQLESDVATGTPPLVVASTTVVVNLNADYLDGLHGTSYVLKSTFDAQTVLAAITDDNPVAITMAAQTILGRITGGNVTALTVAQVLTMLGVADLIDADVATHAALDTGVHGVGSSTVCSNNQALVWAIVFGG